MAEENAAHYKESLPRNAVRRAVGRLSTRFDAMTDDDLDDDETELILNWRKLTDGQRAALRQRMEERYITPETLRELVRAMVPH